jgi:hypothetical protein
VNAPVAPRECASLGCDGAPTGYDPHHTPDHLRAIFCQRCWRCIRAAVTRRGRTREEEAERLRTKGPRVYQARCVWCDRMAPARTMDSVPAEGVGAHECRPGDAHGCAVERRRR